MTIKTEDYTIITASEGYFLTNNNGIYGVQIVLGKYDSPENYQELPLSQWPDDSESEEDIIADQIEEARAAKLRDIDAYDVSNNVNGFFYNGNFMWLDKATRVGLVNSINAAQAVGRDTLNIWYGEIYISLELSEASQLLSLLEVYATDCYNITAQHKATVNNLTTLSEIQSFDITAGYPQRLSFNTQE